MATTSYLGMLELLAHYDDFLTQHTNKLANLGSSSYKLHTIREGFMQLMGIRVLDYIVSRIKRSKWAIELRVFQCQSRGVWTKLMKHATPVERCVTLMPNQGHTAEKLVTRGIDIKHCRGES